jgi:hypothetical protein
MVRERLVRRGDVDQLSTPLVAAKIKVRARELNAKLAAA